MSLRYPPTLVALFVSLTLVLSGPLVGVDAVEPRSATIGDGTATVTDVTIETSALRITAGRFGTGVAYLRVPPATVIVESVAERPRLIYIVSVPRRDVTLLAERLLSPGESGTFRLSPGDQGLDPSATRHEPYNGTVTVRVQSFEMSETVYTENVSIGVTR